MSSKIDDAINILSKVKGLQNVFFFYKQVFGWLLAIIFALLQIAISVLKYYQK